MENASNLSVKLWPEQERPRERLLKGSAAKLSDAELLAVLLRNGTKGCDVVSLSRSILLRFGGWRGIFSAETESLQSFSGLGPAKAAVLLASAEICKRYLEEKLPEGNLLRDPSSVLDYLRISLQDRKREIFKVLFLDKANRLLKEQDLFKGTVDQAAVFPREILRLAVRVHATAVILVHNHPSGRLNPSPEDREITRTIQKACEVIGVRVLDHIIIGNGGHYSFAANGLV